MNAKESENEKETTKRGKSVNEEVSVDDEETASEEKSENEEEIAGKAEITSGEKNVNAKETADRQKSVNAKITANEGAINAKSPVWKYRMYIAVFLLICLVPSVGLLFAGEGQSSENRKKADVPVFSDENGINVHFLNDAGAWFEDHFAFRNEWVSGYALLLGKGFGVSSQENVIVGTDGWLFYKDSLEDFQGSELMNDRQIFDVAHTMAMIQAYAKQQGIKFVFTVAPNKNSLYGDHMPYFYQAYRTGKKNLDQLKICLKEEGVNYVDLYEMLSREERILYHKRDSHWNNEGAALAAGAVLSYLGWAHPSYADREYAVRKDFEGDLDKMLYPAAVSPEEEVYYDPLPQFSYIGEVGSNFDPKIATCSAGEGSLVMYRDSFGNALLPYMAEAFENAYFSRALPYYLPDLKEHKADVLVIERAERFLPELAQEVPYMEAPSAADGVPAGGRAVEVIDLEVAVQGDFSKITGKIPMESLKDHSRIYIKVNGKNCYEAFPVSDGDGQEGFSMLLPAGMLQETDNIFELYLSE